MSLSEAITIIVSEFSEIVGSISIDNYPGDPVPIDLNLVSQYLLTADYGDAEGEGSFLLNEVPFECVAKASYRGRALSPTLLAASRHQPLPDSGARGLTRAVCVSVIADRPEQLLSALATTERRLAEVGAALAAGAAETFVTEALVMVPRIQATIAKVEAIIKIIDPTGEMARLPPPEDVKHAISEVATNDGQLAPLQSLLVGSNPKLVLQELTQALDAFERQLRRQRRVLNGNEGEERVLNGNEGEEQEQDDEEDSIAVFAPKHLQSLSPSFLGHSMSSLAPPTAFEAAATFSPAPTAPVLCADVPGRIGAANLRTIRRLAGSGYDRALAGLRELHLELAGPPALLRLDRTLTADAVFAASLSAPPPPLTTPSTLATLDGMVEPTGTYCALGRLLMPSSSPAPRPCTFIDAATHAPAPAAAAVATLPCPLGAALHAHHVLTAPHTCMTHIQCTSEFLTSPGGSPRHSLDLTGGASGRLPTGADLLPSSVLTHVTKNAAPIVCAGGAVGAVGRALPPASRTALMMHTTNYLASLSLLDIWPMFVTAVFSGSPVVLVCASEAAAQLAADATALLALRAAGAPLGVLPVLFAAHAPPLLAALTTAAVVPVCVHAADAAHAYDHVDAPVHSAASPKSQLSAPAPGPGLGPYGMPLTTDAGEPIQIIDLISGRAVLHGDVTPGLHLGRVARCAREFPTVRAWIAAVSAGAARLVSTATTYASLAQVVGAAEAAVVVGGARRRGLLRRLDETADWRALANVAQLLGADAGTVQVPFRHRVANWAVFTFDLNDSLAE